MNKTVTEKAAADWVSIAQVAEELGNSPINVLMHIKRGLLIGEEIDGQWLVERRSLTELLRRRLTEHVPAVCQNACARKVAGCGSCA